MPPANREPYPKEKAIVGCLLGTAVGDAMGLACEGLTRRRQLRMYPQIESYRLLFNKGLTSDDTEHTCMLAQSLIETGNYHPELLERKFCSNFGWRLRFWLLGLPAGIGLATLRAILKLWIGFPARKSGVYSAGNGPAMRIALIGVCYGEDPQKMRTLVRAATRITHADPKAECGALAVALAAHFAATRPSDVGPAEYLPALEQSIGAESPEFMALIRSMTGSVERKEDSAQFAARIGCAEGISGYMYHTVPAALHVWLSHQSDYHSAVLSMIRLGGDTDTTAAIVGAIVGARVGKMGMPAEWLRDLREWPRTSGWIEQLGITLAARCADGCVSGAVPVSIPRLLVRNVLFLVLVLLHGFRRLLPPY
ncbi:MAG: dinitrogenase reductase [Betaproteobacteria bacterium RIFCSPLOWO2_12_FULL_62_13]|nr:MAG: dinitrogenase reductase [Betaproteobacteria bacterium RIFCSPLOWO2_12_FULL_62_13]